MEIDINFNNKVRCGNCKKIFQDYQEYSKHKCKSAETDLSIGSKEPEDKKE